ncbi:NB-ARC domain-containing protein [Amycolatopsis nigrescens]|uniref:NB-ARC domain-containing protein n=1 Tax=Amycolatopsis nigrescens TaxID=381445 RepID=UPI0003804E93|nr:NB-ARC domain-containing protein [Amycolatopsis nigrescens]
MEPPGAGTHNTVSGLAANVVQLRDFHLHQSRETKVPKQVPSPGAYFTNQADAIARVGAFVARELDALKIVLIIGQPGVGKSELARQCVKLNQGNYPDGHFYANLAGSAERSGLESEILKEFLQQLGVPPSEIPDSLEGRAARFRTETHDLRVMVLADHALTATQVRMLSPGGTGSLVLVTAASRLGSLATAGAVELIDLEPLPLGEARNLLGRIVGPERVDAEPAAVAEVLGFCGRLPIAVCVAGALLTVYPGRRIARLARDLGDERQRMRLLSKDDELSVRAVFTTAYQRLANSAKSAYQVLGLHPGGGEVGLGALVAALDLPDGEVEDAMGELVTTSLVRETAEERYEVHDLVRLHAQEVVRERRDEAGWHEEALARMLAYYRDRAVAAGALMMPQRGWLERLFRESRKSRESRESTAPDVFASPEEASDWAERERGNLRDLAEFAYGREELDLVCLLAVALWPLHEKGKHVEDLIAVNGLGADAARRLGRRDWESLLLSQQGFGHQFNGEPGRAFEVFEAGLAPAREAGYAELEATAIEGMGLARLAEQRSAEARELLTENLALAGKIGDPRRTALARFHLARAERPERALELLVQAREGFLGLQKREEANLAKIALWRGRKLVDAGRFEEAAEALTEALTTMTRESRPFDRAQILEILGDLATGIGDPASAAKRHDEALTVYLTYGFSVQAGQLRSRLSG